MLNKNNKNINDFIICLKIPSVFLISIIMLLLTINSAFAIQDNIVYSYDYNIIYGELIIGDLTSTHINEDYLRIEKIKLDPSLIIDFYFNTNDKMLDYLYIDNRYIFNNDHNYIKIMIYNFETEEFDLLGFSPINNFYGTYYYIEFEAEKYNNDNVIIIRFEQSLDDNDKSYLDIKNLYLGVEEVKKSYLFLDLTDTLTMIIIILILIIGFLLLFIDPLVSGVLYFLLGILLIINEFSIIVSLMIIIFGLLFLFMDKKLKK